MLRAADAGLIPYARNELTDSIFPMKVYEYLAAGLPVVATPLPALAGVDGGRDAPPTREGIAALLEQALAEDSPERRARALARGGGAFLGAAPGGDRRGDRRAVRDLLVTTHTPVLRLAARRCAPTASPARWPRTAG